MGSHDRFSKGYNHPDNQRLRKQREDADRARRAMEEYRKSYSSFKARGEAEIKKLMAERKNSPDAKNRRAIDKKVAEINKALKSNKSPNKEQMKLFAEGRSQVLRKTWWQKLTG